jgi:non-ribosomal peptide synthetase component F
VNLARASKIPHEQEAILAKCMHRSGTFVDFPKDEIEQSIPERFENIVRQYPQRLAVKEGNHTFTYAELNDAVNCVAWGIADHFGKENQALALLLEHYAMAIVGVLVLLKAGKMEEVRRLIAEESGELRRGERRD